MSLGDKGRVVFLTSCVVVAVIVDGGGADVAVICFTFVSTIKCVLLRRNSCGSVSVVVVDADRYRCPCCCCC